MNYKATVVGSIWISVLAVVFGCSRTEEKTARLSDSARTAQSDSPLDNTANSVTSKSGGTLQEANGKASQEESTREDDSEFSDSDEPRAKRGAALTNPLEERSDEPEERNADADDPNAEPIEKVAKKTTDVEPKLDNGRGDGATPKQQAVANGTNDGATTQATDDGRATTDSLPSDKDEDAEKLPNEKLTLPEKLQAFDKNKDGQISLAEWPRDRLSEFNKLDKNKDGFLTSQEWLAGLSEPEHDEAGETDANSPKSPDSESDEDQPDSPKPDNESDGDK